jgi:hypothetical protein
MTTTPNEQHIELTYNPIKSGLSVSQLNMWLVDKAAYEMQYLRGWEAVEPWDPKLNFGKLFMAGIEGYVKSGHQLAGGFSYIDKETEAQIRQYATYDDIHFWSYLSREMLTVFVELHSDWLLEYCEESETKHTIELETPNGKTFVLSRSCRRSVPRRQQTVREQVPCVVERRRSRTGAEVGVAGQLLLPPHVHNLRQAAKVCLVYERQKTMGFRIEKSKAEEGRN